MSTESNSFVQPAIPRFDGHYDHWAMLMENFLKSKEYWDLVEKELPTAAIEATEVQRKAIADLKLKDLKVKNYLFQAIDRNIIETILNKETAKSIWDSMRLKYQGSTKVKRAQLQALRREFELLGMREGEKVNDYFARTLIIANKMRSQGEKLEQSVIIEKILRSMTLKFNYVVCSIEESNDVSSMSIDELQSSLLVHEQRMIGQKEEEHVLNITNTERARVRDVYRIEGRGRARGTFRARGRSWNRQPLNKAFVECFNCHKLGHFQFECPQVRNIANYTEFVEDEEMLLMSYIKMDKSTNGESVWFLDSGCSNHMCGSRSFFSNFDGNFRQSVKLGDNSKMMVMGKGNIRLQVGGMTQVITEVYFAPELKNNLLSVGQLLEKGLTILIQDGMCNIYHPERGVIMQSRMSTNRMFVVSALVKPQHTACFQTVTNNNSHLWHCRFGHLSMKGLRTLFYKKMVNGLPMIQASSQVCPDCLVGKQHREVIPKRSLWRASKQLQLVHSDICGPIKPESYSHKRYLINFIDDYSRKSWVYFLSEKSEAFDVFKKFKIFVEKEVSSSICCLHTDRGGEYTSMEFNHFCSTNGITRQLTASYTPQQNGVAERKNRTVMNMVRSMLSEKQIPKEFWPEAVNWATHVLNRCPTTSLKEITPEEAWSGNKFGALF